MTDSDPDRTLSRATARRGMRQPTGARLRVVYPADLDWSMPLGQGRVVVGRVANDSEVPPLVHETVSRSHCAIEWDVARRAHSSSDLGSHNGTRVDGVPVAEGRHALVDGAVLQLGDVLLVYECGRGVTAPAAPEVSEDNIPGDSAAIRLVRAAVARAAPDPSPVLLIGETGTGKEWIAREIHRLSRTSRPMLAINCSALSPQIIDSQLFGHVRGAFTGANSDHDGLFRAADGGTLFLDEIGELPLELQPKLLRVLQEGQVQPVGSTRTVKVEVRVLAATNRDLTASIEAGEFRRDLYARLALWEIRVPPLCDRRADVLSWIDRLHRKWSEQRDGVAAPPLTFHPEVADLLVRHAWPDNLRGLDRLIHELATGAVPGRPVAREDMPPWLQTDATGNSAVPIVATPRLAPTPVSRPAKRPVPSRDEFVAVFEQLEGNVRAMAKHFGRDRRQIYRWLDSFGLNERRKNIRSDD
ncbi:MAG TPA: sigma 54-interacting transcriptional regulator [Kofleriaceae bacterium]|nr:sigma 54-interacting transcriptional regulator [Kofleriaceae bacterium]